MDQPADRSSLDSLLNWLMDLPPGTVIGGSYTVSHLVADLADMAEVELTH